MSSAPLGPRLDAQLSRRTFLSLTGFKVQLGTFAWVCLVTRMLKADWNMIIASAISWNLISSQFPLISVVMHLITADGLSEIS